MTAQALQRPTMLRRPIHLVTSILRCPGIVITARGLSGNLRLLLVVSVDLSATQSARISASPHAAQ